MPTIHALITGVMESRPGDAERDDQREVVEEITREVTIRLLSLDSPEEVLLVLVRAEVMKSVRTGTRTSEHDHAAQSGYGSSGKRKWHKRHPDSDGTPKPRVSLDFLDTWVHAPNRGTGALIRWGEATREDCEAIASWRKVRHLALKVSYEFAWQQQILMSATDAGNLREAYKISETPIPGEDPEAGLAAA